MTSIKITFKNELATVQNEPLGKKEIPRATVGELEKESIAALIYTRMKILEPQIQAGGSAGEVTDGSVRPEANDEMDITQLSNDHLQGIFGPMGPSRYFERYIKMTDKKTGKVTQHQIQDWGSLPRNLVCGPEPMCLDFNTCRTYAAIVEFLDQHDNNRLQNNDNESAGSYNTYN